MSACVVFGGYIDPTGYGKTGHRWAHREALELKLGRPIAPGMYALHTCDNRACVKPEHLYEGTQAQNMADCSARGRHNKPRGEDHWRSRLSASDVGEIRSRAAAGESHKAQARRLGVHPVTISRIARGIWRTEVSA